MAIGQNVLPAIARFLDIAVGRFRRRPEPGVPIQFRAAASTGGNRAAGRIAVDPALDGFHFADAVIADQFGRDAELEPHLGALLAAGLQDAAGFLRHFRDGPRFFDCQCQRLFAVDVLAFSHRVDCDERVPVIRRRDQHALNVLAIVELRGNREMSRSSCPSFLKNSLAFGSRAGHPHRRAPSH